MSRPLHDVSTCNQYLLFICSLLFAVKACLMARMVPSTKPLAFMTTPSCAKSILIHLTSRNQLMLVGDTLVKDQPFTSTKMEITESLRSHGSRRLDSFTMPTHWSGFQRLSTRQPLQIMKAGVSPMMRPIKNSL